MIASIGIFDSGIGGFSVLRAIREQLPWLPVVYVADQAHVPYGGRGVAEIRALSFGVVQHLVETAGVGLVVVACNTASAAALRPLRAARPDTPFVGMEPAVKPAARLTRGGTVGVLATPATLQGELYAGVVRRFAPGLTVLEDPCAGLVERIEAGDLAGPKTREILARAVLPMLERGADVLVLGCTHYPFVLPLIRELAGPAVQIIDPAPAVARHTAQLLAERGGAGPPREGAAAGRLRILTTGAAATLARQIQALLPAETPETGQLAWLDGRLLPLTGSQ
ncbi:MAG: glutamate racemase [Lentisphaeria bacterium]